MNKFDHHYTECGLSNVYISNMPFERDDEGDELITIPAVNELHQMIATAIVKHAKGISGDELRFLRSEMGYTQAELAALAHRDKQSIGRWERGEIEIDSATEVFIRRLAIEKLGLDVNLGIDELSRRSVSSAQPQPISIQKVDGEERSYRLVA